MRFASMRNLDISNGEGVGVSLFVQGCDRHCFNCFNPDTWDFNGGKEWTEETKNKFIKLIDRPYINRISVLGGEPLAEQNLDEVLSLIKEIRISFPEKTIWLYTGFEWNQIMNIKVMQPIFSCEDLENKIQNVLKRQEIIKQCDVLVDGEYIDEQKDLSLKFRGSSNQRVIDVKQSLTQNKVVLYCD
jgi:anaerobic ribonucleoside-triphosphate reductase activating protein